MEIDFAVAHIPVYLMHFHAPLPPGQGVEFFFSHSQLSRSQILTIFYCEVVAPGVSGALSFFGSYCVKPSVVIFAIFSSPSSSSQSETSCTVKSTGCLLCSACATAAAW